MGSMTIDVKEVHGKNLCEKLQDLRADTNLVDLDIVCEGTTLSVHRCVLAASW